MLYDPLKKKKKIKDLWNRKNKKHQTESILKEINPEYSLEGLVL